MVRFTSREHLGVNWLLVKTQIFCFCSKKGLNDSEQQAVTSFYLCVYLWPFPRSYTFTLFMSFSVLCSLKEPALIHVHIQCHDSRALRCPQLAVD